MTINLNTNLLDQDLNSYAGYEKPFLENTAEFFNPQKGGADEKANALRRAIINTTDNLEIQGKEYYISYRGSDDNSGDSKEKAWKTVVGYINHINQLRPGDAVLFERGGVYRGSFPLVSGVSYGAFGTGPKPHIYGSPNNFADESLWDDTGTENLWVCTEPLLYDIGVIIFNHGKAVGLKRLEGRASLKSNYQFYHDLPSGRVYLYLDEGNPGALFDDIELCPRQHVLIGGRATDITIDNLCIKYGGAHGINFCDTKDVRITNCEVGWIGGSLQHERVRFGNGIEFWNSCENVLIENCWVYQCYDAGITHQGDPGSIHSKVIFRGNLIEYCTYAIELFLIKSQGHMKDILYEENILRFSGYGWGTQRPDPDAESLLNGWGYYHPAENFIIQNNIFDLSTRNLIYMHHKGTFNIRFKGNTYYQKGNQVAKWNDGNLNAYSQIELEEQIEKIEASPNHIKFIE
jgi:hypothetical protein